ncbi:MAG: hypothetical protein WBD25_11345 [Terriglobales bacterium]|jgi:hypothetical protein
MLKLTSVKFLAGVVLVAALAAPRIAVGATGPGVGIYVVSSYVVSATATNGGTCGAVPGDYLASYFYYPGPAKTGAVERHSINGSEGNVIQELDFPVTPAAGVDTWSGEYHGRRRPGSGSETATFSTTFAFVDTNSFVGTTTYMYSVGQDSICTTVFQDTYIRTGKLPTHTKASE